MLTWPSWGVWGRAPPGKFGFKHSEIASGAFLGKCFSMCVGHLNVLVGMLLEFQGGQRGWGQMPLLNATLVVIVTLAVFH